MKMAQSKNLVLGGAMTDVKGTSVPAFGTVLIKRRSNDGTGQIQQT
jgi:hypothetical protein